ncbi:hypothetical protein ABI59_02760 [Acidobacteria bacterium Mor1]|nr:hypothetical protein ABI59_02760 [Acidobacteria bacterium Mor1]
MSVRLSQRISGVQRTLIRQMFDAAPAGAINLGLGQPDLPTPGVVAEAGHAAIDQGRTGYTTTAGDPELRQHIAANYPGFVSAAEEVVVTVGSQEALYATFLALTDPGDEVLLPDPGYPAYPTVARLVGAVPRTYPLRAERGFVPDPDEIGGLITPRTRVLLLCSPSNPTGAVTDPETTRALTDLAASRGISWISDEVYAAFVYDRPAGFPWQTGAGNGVVVSSLSKNVSMTGWRVGWAAAPAEVATKITAAHQHLATCAPSISQRAAVAAFSAEGRVAEREYLEEFRARRDLMEGLLRKIPGVDPGTPAGAFYIFADVRAHGDSTALAWRLLEEQQVVTVPGEAFGAAGAGYLRLSYAASREAIREGVGRLERMLGGG